MILSDHEKNTFFKSFFSLGRHQLQRFYRAAKVSCTVTQNAWMTNCRFNLFANVTADRYPSAFAACKKRTGLVISTQFSSGPRCGGMNYSLLSERVQAHRVSQQRILWSKGLKWKGEIPPSQKVKLKKIEFLDIDWQLLQKEMIVLYQIENLWKQFSLRRVMQCAPFSCAPFSQELHWWCSKIGIAFCKSACSWAR